MNSKERVAITLRHEEADRVPMNYAANPGIHGRLLTHFGIDEGPESREQLLQCLGVDFRHVAAPYRGPVLHEPSKEPGRHISADWGMHARYVEHGGGGYWEPWGKPLEDMDEETAATYPMPSPDDYDYAAVQEQAARYHDRAVILHVGFEVMNITARYVGDERMYIALSMGDPAVLHFIERFVAIKQEILRRSLEAAKGGVDIVWIGEDLGTQRGPRISRDLFRERIRPIHERTIALAKEHGLPVFIHSCGSSSWAFDDFIEMGIDAVDTLQPEAKDMSPAYLKAQYGGRLAFHGCISTAGPLATGSAEETAAYCRSTLDTMMPGGGYCFAPTHMIQDPTPVANVVAMYDTARHRGRYGRG